jgi:hypothetical protein
LYGKKLNAVATSYSNTSVKTTTKTKTKTKITTTTTAKGATTAETGQRITMIIKIILNHDMLFILN